MEIIKNYRNEEKLRTGLNELAEKTFSLSFEDWYNYGFWNDNYIPYSVFEDGKIVANVSVNICNMMLDSKKLNLIQLGTVMTRPEYRNRGYSRLLMEEIEKDFSGEVDGFFLFANDSVLDFYPKFGFEKAKEYVYTATKLIKGECKAENIPIESIEDMRRIHDIISKKKQLGRFYMVDNADLFMFYLSQFMNENVYYIKELDAIAIAQIEDSNLMLHAVFCNDDINLDSVIEAFGSNITNVTLGFTPKDGLGYEIEEASEEDTTLFVKGGALKDFGDQVLMFQTLCHA